MFTPPMISPSEHLSFLKAILAAPRDDLPRLVYADRLDEGGDPRGEFIRVQCKLTTSVRPACNCEEQFAASGLRDVSLCAASQWDLWMAAAREREGELLKAGYWREWVGPVLLGIWNDHIAERTLYGRRELPEHAFHFARGFISHVTCSWDDWDQHGDAILAATPLETVVLTSMPPYSNYGEPVTRRQCVHMSRNGRSVTEWASEVEVEAAGGERELLKLGQQMLERCLSRLWEGVEFDVGGALAQRITETNVLRRRRGVLVASSTY